jgi:uncharacterized membrane protein HdeD (DUF308 family)
MANPSLHVLDGLDRPPPDRWWVHLLLGTALAVLGIVLLVDPRVAASTLALLVGLALVLHGLDDLLDPGRRRGLGAVAGGVSVVAGIVAMVWPDVTLWALAVITGMSFIALGSLKVTTGLMVKGEPGWTWVLAGGVVSGVLGVLALTWPAATVVVLALVLGLRTLLAGLAEIAFAVEAHRAVAPR